MENLEEEIKQLNEKDTEEDDEIFVVLNNPGQSASGVKRLKDSQAAGIAMTFDDQGSENFTDIDIKIKEELSKD